MQYDEQYFKKSANRKAMVIWLILGVVLSGAYAVEIVKGLRTVVYYVQFLALCWIPFFAGIVILKIKGFHTDLYKQIVVIGYGIFYVFVLLTTTSTLSFVYLLPLASMLILYKDRNFMILCGISNLIVLIISVVMNIKRGLNAPADITQYEIQIACILLCYSGYILSINHLQNSDGALMDSLKGNLSKIVSTVETVKLASNEIVDGMFSVRELADENIIGANTVVSGMVNLTSNSTELQRSTRSSLDLTETISTQVENVASKISETVELASESASHAKISLQELADVVELSIEVEEVLREFTNQFKKMSDEINMIENITMQTNILSLNASVEAARAGAAGKGFAVVAGEIRELSSKTKSSSDSIFAALQHLENTSQKMTNSITQTLEKVKQVNNSVGKITDDTTQMGDNIQVIDTAISEVKTSNTKLVDNMHVVSNVVDMMTSSIVGSEETTKAMLDKSVETTKNVADVESTVGKLMEELGVIGVMGIRDIKVGQLAQIAQNNLECNARITEIVSDGVVVELAQNWQGAETKCDFIATVENSYFRWNDTEMTRVSKNDSRRFKILLEKQPSVVNRRKYKRAPITNSAHIVDLDSNNSIYGEMINLSAGGFAFKTKDTNVEYLKNNTVRLFINDFPSFRDNELDARVIRVGKERGVNHIGCRFLYDNLELMSYLKKME